MLEGHPLANVTLEPLDDYLVVEPLDESELPTRAPRSDGPPLPRAWADRDPVAARRLVFAREALGQLAEQRELPVENLLTPDYLRRVLWTPPATRDPDSLAAAVADGLDGLGARAEVQEVLLGLVGVLPRGGGERRGLARRGGDRLERDEALEAVQPPAGDAPLGLVVPV